MKKEHYIISNGRDMLYRMCPSLFQKNILALTPISELVTEVKSVIK
jgi:hypothetical protein